MNEHPRDMILDGISEHVIYYDPDIKIVWANRSACESLKMDLSEITGNQCFRIWYGLEEPCRGCPVKKSFITGEYEEGTVTTFDRNTWLIKASPMREKGGLITGVVEVATDITELKQKEKDGARANILNEIVNAMPDSLIVFNTQGVCIFANRMFEVTFNLKSKNLIGKNFMDIPGFGSQKQEEIIKYMPLFREALTTGRGGPADLTIRNSEGRDIHVHGKAGSIPDEKGNVKYIVVSLHDVSKLSENK